MSLIETGPDQETRFYSPDMTAGGQDCPGQVTDVCTTELSHSRGSLHEFHQKSDRANPSLRLRGMNANFDGFPTRL
jgi:hypothetical protein